MKKLHIPTEDDILKAAKKGEEAALDITIKKWWI